MTKTTEKEGTLETALELLDAAVKARCDAELEEMKQNERIVGLVVAARAHGASMPELARHVKRVDRSTRRAVTVSRQALENMLNKAGINSTRGDYEESRLADDEARAHQMYSFHLEGHSLSETGERFGVSARTASKMFSRYGLEVRRARRAPARSRLNAEALS